MAIVIFAMLCFLFAAKIVWNIALPYRIWRERSRGQLPEDKPANVSLDFIVEVALLGVTIAWAHYVDINVKCIAVIGGVTICVSYVHLIAMSYAYRRRIIREPKRKRKRQGNDHE
jgi:hypothetical protein